MRILVFSDTHGKIDACTMVIERMGQVDMLLHLGDMMRDALRLRTLYPHIPLELVPGNNDASRGAPHKLIAVQGKKIYMTHGHSYSSANRVERLARDAREAGAEMALFGHTHVSLDGWQGGVRLINPGSISFPRDHKHSCAVIEVEDGCLDACIYIIY